MFFMKKKHNPLNPPTWEIADASAFQAMQRGEATPEQQQRVLDWLVHRACRTYDVTYEPGSYDATAFSEGRRFVGLQIVKMLKINIAAWRKV